MKVIYVVTNIIIIRRRDICRPPRGTRLAMTKGRLLHSVVHSSVVGGIQVLPASINGDFQLLLLVVPIGTYYYIGMRQSGQFVAIKVVLLGALRLRESRLESRN